MDTELKSALIDLVKSLTKLAEVTDPAEAAALLEGAGETAARTRPKPLREGKS